MAKAKAIEELPRLVSWRDGGKVVNVNGEAGGKSVFYGTEGDFGRVQGAAKPKLVLVHGYPTASADYRRVLPSLKEHFDLFYWDFVGYGFSEKAFVSLQEQVSILEALLVQEFGVDPKEEASRLKIHIFSHDLGVTIMQEMLHRDLQRSAGADCAFSVLSVVTLNGGMFPDLHRPTLVQQLLVNAWTGPVVAMFLSPGVFQRGINKVFGTQKPSILEVEEFYALVHCNGNEAGQLTTKNIQYIEDRRQNASRYVAALKEWSRLRPEGEGILLINGPADPVSGRHLGAAFTELVPNSKVVFLADGIGHWPQLEDPHNTLSAFYNFHTRLGTLPNPPAAIHIVD